MPLKTLRYVGHSNVLAVPSVTRAVGLAPGPFPGKRPPSHHWCRCSICRCNYRASQAGCGLRHLGRPRLAAALLRYASHVPCVIPSLRLPDLESVLLRVWLQSGLALSTPDAPIHQESGALNGGQGRRRSEGQCKCRGDLSRSPPGRTHQCGEGFSARGHNLR